MTPCSNRPRSILWQFSAISVRRQPARPVSKVFSTCHYNIDMMCDDIIISTIALKRHVVGIKALTFGEVLYRHN